MIFARIALLGIISIQGIAGFNPFYCCFGNENGGDAPVPNQGAEKPATVTTKPQSNSEIITEEAGSQVISEPLQSSSPSAEALLPIPKVSPIDEEGRTGYYLDELSIEQLKELGVPKEVRCLRFRYEGKAYIDYIYTSFLLDLLSEKDQSNMFSCGISDDRKIFYTPNDEFNKLNNYIMILWNDADGNAKNVCYAECNFEGVKLDFGGRALDYKRIEVLLRWQYIAKDLSKCICNIEDFDEFKKNFKKRTAKTPWIMKFQGFSIGELVDGKYFSDLNEDEFCQIGQIIINFTVNTKTDPKTISLKIEKEISEED